MPFLAASAGGDRLVGEHAPRGADGGELQLLLGAEVGEQAALAHPQLARELAIERSWRPSAEASRIERARIARRVLSPRARRPSTWAGGVGPPATWNLCDEGCRK